MPSRWLIPFAPLDVARVQPTYVHAAVSRWFDDTSSAHEANLKPYSLSPLHHVPGGCGLEIGILTEQAERRLHHAAHPGVAVRLGAQSTIVTGPPIPLLRVSWEDLAQRTSDRAWVVRFASPASFRQGGRTSPWPAPGAVLRGLGQRWDRWSGRAPREVGPQVASTVWVSDVEGASEVVTFGRGQRMVHYSGFVGRIRYQCDDGAAAAAVGPLFALADFTGVGSATTKGLGVTRLEPTWQPAVPRATPA